MHQANLTAMDFGEPDCFIQTARRGSAAIDGGMERRYDGEV
jgi:hypothetical protein